MELKGSFDKMWEDGQCNVGFLFPLGEKTRGSILEGEGILLVDI